MDETITVFIHDGDELPRAITVRVSDSIRVIDETIQEKGQRVFYCNGSIILPAFSFKYFGIKNNDHIFVIHKKEPKYILQSSPKKNLPINTKVKKKTIFKENRIDSYCHPLNKYYLLNEASRIADLTYIQNEKSLMINSCFSSEPEEAMQHSKSLGIQQQTLISTSSFPSSEALPHAWRTF